MITEMNYLKGLKNIVLGDNSEEKISKILPISEKDFACDPSECHNTYKESCFDLRGDAASAPLYETSRAPDLHFLVSTGKTDWEHDAFEEKDTILPLVSKHADDLSGKCKINIKCNVTNQSLNISEPDAITLKRLDILLLPWFVWIKGVTEENIAQVFKAIREILSSGIDEIKGRQAEILISKLKSVDGVTLVKDENKSYVLLCSHKTRDKKCGITAPIMKKEFDSQLRDLELYRDAGDDRPDGVKVLFVNHVGGHKFAANVMVYNTHGEFVWFARCTPLNVNFIINETVLNHKVNGKNVRACSKFDPITW